MKDWSTDKLVSIGLVAMGVLSIIGYIVHSVMTGDNRGTEIPLAIVGALAGYMGKGHVQQNEQPTQQSQTSQTLGQVADVANQAQQAVNAVEAIADVIKPKK